MRGEEDTRITMQNQETSYTTSSGEVPEISSCPPLTLCFPDDTCNSYLVEGREYCFTAESPNSRGGSSDEDEYAHGIDEATLNDLGVPISPIVSEDSITNMVVNNFTLPPHAGGNVLFQTASRTSSIPSRTRSIPSGTSSIHRLGSNEESSSSDGEIEATSWSTTKLSHLNDSSLSYHDWVCAWGSAWGHSTSLQEQKRYEKRRMIKSKGRGEVQTCRKMKTSVGEKMQTKSVSAHQKERIKTIKSQLRKQINNSSTSIEASGIKTPRSISQDDSIASNRSTIRRQVRNLMSDDSDNSDCERDVIVLEKKSSLARIESVEPTVVQLDRDKSKTKNATTSVEARVKAILSFDDDDNDDEYLYRQRLERRRYRKILQAVRSDEDEDISSKLQRKFLTIGAWI